MTLHESMTLVIPHRNKNEMKIKLTITDPECVADIKATGARELMEIINRTKLLRISSLSIYHIDDKNIELRASGDSYIHYHYRSDSTEEK